MSFHVVRHEHPTILVMNRQTYETYRFTMDVALAHVGPPCDLAKARRTAMGCRGLPAFLFSCSRYPRPLRRASVRIYLQLSLLQRCRS